MAVWFYPGQEDYITKLNELGAIAEMLSGPDGWSPVLGVVSDGGRRVFQVTDWVGGETTKPDVGQYVGSTGYVTDIADAVDIRGPQGDDGDDGPANVLSIGTVTGGITADATITGTSPSQVLNLVLPQGAQGDPGVDGVDGEDGAAATITVGTVTTGAPGTSASITNVGSASAAVFDFTIPRGDAGAGSGDVIGPTSSTDNAIALFDGTDGKLLKSGGVLASVATSGSYNDLTDKPTVSVADWDTLENKPAVIAAGATAADARTVIGAGTSNLVLGTTAGTALEGNTPIPAAQQQTDWNAPSGITAIANKPPVIAAGADAAAARAVIGALGDALSDGKLYARKDAEWVEVTGGGGTGAETGDVVVTARALTTPDWLECGAVYLKSSYPALSTLLGSIPGVEWLPASGAQPASVVGATVTANGAIVAVGSFGRVFRSTDNGTNWVPITGPNTTDNMRTVTVAKNTSGQPDVLIAVGGAGSVWRSLNDGLNWTKITGPNTTDQLFGVSASGNIGGAVVAVGSDGVVWRSANIGATWTKIAGPNTTDLLYSVVFVNAAIVFATGASNAIWKSNNGGESWTRVAIGASNSGQYAIKLNASVLLSASPTSRIARSADSGGTWVDVGFTPANTSNCIGIARLSDTEAFVVQANGTIRHTRDEGLTWVEVPNPGSASASCAVSVSATKAVILTNAGSWQMDGIFYDSATQFITPKFSGSISGAKRYIKS